LTYAGGVSTSYSLSEAKAKCAELGAIGAASCRAVSCDPGGACTVRASSHLNASTANETTYTPSSYGTSSCFATGCPEQIVAVKTEGLFSLQLSGFANTSCVLNFQGPSGTVLAMAWRTVSLPAGCETNRLLLRDGLGPTAREHTVVCGSTMPELVSFSGNSARGELHAAAGALSLIEVWLTFQRNQLEFHLSNPGFDLGSDIHVPWSLSMGIPSAPDFGWVGLFKAGTCTSGIAANECYIASQSLPQAATAGTFIFYFSDYKTAGEYEIRYFAGDSRGTDCQVLNFENSDGDGAGDEYNQINRCTYTVASLTTIYVLPGQQPSDTVQNHMIPGYGI